jgi:hypothetical protein
MGSVRGMRGLESWARPLAGTIKAKAKTRITRLKKTFFLGRISFYLLLYSVNFWDTSMTLFIIPQSKQPIKALLTSIYG